MTDKPSAADAEIDIQNSLGNSGGWVEGSLGAIEANEALKEEREKNKDLETKTMTDPVTGVGNFRALEKWLSEDEKRQEFQKIGVDERRSPTGRLYPTFGVVVFMDADGLGKADEKGHEYGDSFLKAVADSGLEIANRPLDILCRRGDKSDEFIALLPGDQIKDFEALEEKFNKAILQNSGGKNFSASMAFGVYGQGRTARETVNLLDKQLSEAKAGRPKGAHIDTIFYKQ